MIHKVNLSDGVVIHERRNSWKTLCSRTVNPAWNETTQPVSCPHCVQRWRELVESELDFNLDPATWGVVLANRNPHRQRPPEIHWGQHSITRPGYRDHKRPRATLTRAAANYALEILGPGIDPREVGVIVRRGDGEDAGYFGLEFHCYPRGTERLHPLSSRVSFSESVTFSAGQLYRVQNRGWSLLRRHGRMLIGRLGCEERPWRK